MKEGIVGRREVCMGNRGRECWKGERCLAEGLKIGSRHLFTVPVMCADVWVGGCWGGEGAGRRRGREGAEGAEVDGWRRGEGGAGAPTLVCPILNALFSCETTAAA